MIAKHIAKKAANDRYRALALYIADAKTGRRNGRENEKILASWFTGCLAETYQEAIREIEAVQALNTKTGKEKTYHLLVSFRPEDEAKLNPEVCRKIERRFAEKLGFADHQRHCGIHKNTDNFHLHVAYNMIHTVNFTRREPFRDYYLLAQTCREIEREYGLKADPGLTENAPNASRKPAQNPDRNADETKPKTPCEKVMKRNVKSQTLEAHSGRESFHTFVAKRKEKIMAARQKSASWMDFQAELLAMGMEVKPRGNGLVFKDRKGQNQVKASDIDRSLAKSKLEARWGAFQAPSPEFAANVTALESYSATPLQLQPDRENLFTLFQREMTERKAALAAIKETEVRLFAAQRQKRAAKMKLIGRFALTKADKTRLLQKLKNREREELAAARLELAERRKAILAAWPYTTWNKCLQHKAALGNETALAVLRSKKEVATPENPPEALAVSQETLDPTQKIMDAHGLSQAQLRALLAVARMREIWGRSARNGADEGSLRHRVDHKGTVIFYLPGGGSVRDAGREIHFSAHDLAALNLAEKLAAVKWGRGAVLADGVFRFAPQTEQEKVLSR